jgi:hypothetical protein
MMTLEPGPLSFSLLSFQNKRQYKEKKRKEKKTLCHTS